MSGLTGETKMDTKFNRRNFIKTSAAAASLLPSFNVLGKAAQTIGPKDDDVNVAVIGYGAEGEILTDAAMKIPGVRFKVFKVNDTSLRELVLSKKEKPRR